MSSSTFTISISAPPELQEAIRDVCSAHRVRIDLTSGNYIAHVAGGNVCLPFGRYDRVPEPDLAHEGVVMAAVHGRGRRLGVLRP